MNDFVNPKSMMTPGAAGALVMFLSNAVSFQFPEVTPRWLALALSFVLGAIVVGAAKPKVLAASGLWLVNSLVIFAVAVGSAGEAAKMAGPAASGVAAAVNRIIPSAHAQSAPASAPGNAATIAQLRAQLALASAKLAAQQAQLAAAHQALAARSPDKSVGTTPQPAQKHLGADSQRFFKVW